MYLQSDYVEDTPRGGHCRIRVYASEETGAHLVVLCTELPDNPGMSITLAAEQIAARVIDRHGVKVASLRTPFVWVEHYESGSRGTPNDPHTFDLVTFSHYEVKDTLRAGEWAKEIGSPRWRPSTRRQVEMLIGQRVD